ncbi:osmoprotectant transport system permease protein [Herbihabitans rhizosphaerae]|uniref:Osmoprotectant transport system permease protein n=1 Tax=Herbihabitans rhizosphaerae TaxID=1872711 RepID=A0A4Q7KGQ4_9PSEU|nr:ABC transporter permease subunit [Herbihabitans rhizosphaerae]RZS32756.1 osmoprotectant transport system permease protein [Herbihabitans rhizosphaerae]
MIFSNMIDWLTNGANWQGPEGIPTRVGEHVYYAVLAVLVASAVAVPLGLFVGHTGRGAVFVVAISNALRALPTLGLVTLFVLLLGLGDWPVLIGLIILAVPPILSGTYAGVQDVDRGVIDAARGMGMTGWQRLWKVEVPNALPLLIGGVRSAVLQVVATVAVAAFVGLGGLGRILLSGQKTYKFEVMLGAAVLIALLAVVLDQIIAAIQRLVVPKGLTVAAKAAAPTRGGK